MGIGSKASHAAVDIEDVSIFGFAGRRTVPGAPAL
jgi:hypothetical protein